MPQFTVTTSPLIKSCAVLVVIVATLLVLAILVIVSSTPLLTALELHPVIPLSPKELYTAAAMLSPGANKKVNWICKKDKNHQWRANVNQRTRLGTGCPYCAGQRATTKRNLTNSQNGILALWDYDKNPKPENFLPKSNQRVYWKCGVDDTHRWEASVYSLQKSIESGNNGCPFCAGKIVNESNALSSVHPELLTEWDYEKNTVHPERVYHSSSRKVHWKCSKGPDHEWVTSISNRIGNKSKKPTNCPICTGQKCVPSVSLKAKHPELMDEWDWNNNRVNPDEIYPNYNKKLFWICKNNRHHVWKATPNKRAGIEKLLVPIVRFYLNQK